MSVIAVATAFRHFESARNLTQNVFKRKITSCQSQVAGGRYKSQMNHCWGESATERSML